MAVDAGLQLDLTDAQMEQDIEAQVKAAAFADTPNGTAHGPTYGAGSTNGSANGSTNGTSNGHGTVVAASGAVATATVAPATVHSAQDIQTAAVQAVLADKMGDAPLCDTCGHITVRNGSCYRCLNCGESKGCS
jgi:hypothetical protein